ncbi:MAG: CvpA family protein [Agathobacter sp.]|nr:CvpA family protein [Agathobacter sp.]
MNWLLIVILAVVIGNVVWGYKMGFLKVALSLVSWVIVLIACHVVTPVVADAIIDNTPLAEVIQETVSEKLNEVVDEVAGGVADAIDTEAIAEIEAKLPEQLKASILGEHESVADLITSTGEVEVDTTELANGAAYLIGLIIVLIVTRIALMVVEKVLGLVSKLPLIGQADTILGIAAGALKGLVWGWVVLTVIAMLAYTGANTDLIALVNESEILLWLYENNPIMMVVSKVL